MKKKIFFVIQLFVVAMSLFAKQTLDDAILDASIDITKECVRNKKKALAVYDIESSSDDMSSHIKDKLEEYIHESSKLTIVTRDPKNMATIEKELYDQHHSGKFDEHTIISVMRKRGAEVLVTGDFKERKNAWMLILEILDVETGDSIFKKRYEISRSEEIEELLGERAGYRKVALGIDAEVNKNSLDFVSPAVSASFDYSVFRKLSLGFKMFASFDVKEKDNNLTILEPLALLRVYLVSQSGEPGTGVFLEGLGGVSILLVDSDTKFVANGGGGFGYRFAFSNFYIEPEIRVGYPYIFGAGLGTGFRF